MYLDHLRWCIERCLTGASSQSQSRVIGNFWIHYVGKADVSSEGVFRIVISSLNTKFFTRQIYLISSDTTQKKLIPQRYLGHENFSKVSEQQNSNLLEQQSNLMKLPVGVRWSIGHGCSWWKYKYRLQLFKVRGLGALFGPCLLRLVSTMGRVAGGGGLLGNRTIAS